LGASFGLSSGGASSLGFSLCAVSFEGALPVQASSSRAQRLTVH